MRPYCLFLALALVVSLSPEAFAGEPAGASSPGAAAAAAPRITLGPTITDGAGQSGRLHTVASGETLWDISEAYLGTPWVWPSVWKGEPGSESRLRPGDVLFISQTEIRSVTPEQAASLRASAPAAPAAMGDAYDADSGASVAPGAGSIDRWTAFNSLGFVSREGSGVVGEIIGNPTERSALATGDVVYIDLGAGKVQKGDRLRVFRAQRNVPDPDTGRLIGTFVEPLAWLEVTEVEADASAAMLHGAVSEVQIGDLIVPMGEGGEEFGLTPTAVPGSVRGEIVHMVGERVIGGGMDVIYLNRGTDAGLSPGSALEVVRPGGMLFDPVQGRTVKVPDTIVGHLLVLTSRPAGSAAFVVHSTTDLVRGDYWRGADSIR